jgi:hypothetical protein
MKHRKIARSSSLPKKWRRIATAVSVCLFNTPTSRRETGAFLPCLSPSHRYGSKPSATTPKRQLIIHAYRQQCVTEDLFRGWPSVSRSSHNLTSALFSRIGSQEPSDRTKLVGLLSIRAPALRFPGINEWRIRLPFLQVECELRLIFVSFSCGALTIGRVDTRSSVG